MLAATTLDNGPVYVSFDHHTDKYWFGKLVSLRCFNSSLIFDQSIDRQIDSNHRCQVVKNVLPTQISPANLVIVLVGNDTWKRRYVDWEIGACLEQGKKLVGIQLPSLSVDDGVISMPARLLDNVRSGYATWLKFEDVVNSENDIVELLFRVSGGSGTDLRNERNYLLEDAN